MTQTQALKAAIEQLGSRHKPSPGELAEQMGLIGAFRSGVGDLAAGHPQWVKYKMRATLQVNALDAAPAVRWLPPTKRKDR